MDVGTAKDDNATDSRTSAAATPSNVTIDGGGITVDEGRVELDSIQHTSTSTGDADEGVVERVQKKRIRVPAVSRKGKRAIISCVLSIIVGVAAGVFIGLRMIHGGYNTPVLLGDICGTTL